MYFDSCVFDADALEYLANKAGTDRVMLGSDMPFPIGDPEPQKIVTETGLKPDQLASITGGLAARLFRVT
jgi:aminocarboxymuconate-semialdehyde decarboxylase